MIGPAWAQAAAGGAPPAAANFLPLLLVFVIFYFVLIRPQQQKAKEHRNMLASLKRNDQVVTAGGIYGRVMALSEKVVTVEIAPNVHVKIDREQITALATEAKAGGEDTKDVKEKDKAK